jgi:ATP-binding cassette subfamily B protein
MRAAGGLGVAMLQLWNRLKARRRHQFVLLLGLMLVSALAEVVSLGAILPFLAILTAPERILKVPIIASLARTLKIGSAADLVLPLAILFALAALTAGAIRMVLALASTRLAFAAGADFSNEVYQRTLYQPYSVHVARNSSEVISSITHKVANVVEVLYQSLMLITSSFLLLAITIALLFIDARVAIAATLGFGVSYGVIAWLSRRRLHRNSARIAAEQTRVIKALQEGLGGIRDVLLDGSQEVYCDIYRRADQPLRRAQANNLFLAASPRFAMEALGMVLIAALAYGLSQQPGGVATALPALGALALGAQRLLPVLQQAYTAWATIAGRYTSVLDTLDLLAQPMNRPVAAAHEPLVFSRTVQFHQVRFRYTHETPWVLDHFDLTIPKGARVGLVGSTGSGKSTAADVLMGLLQPNEGQLLVDGRSIEGERINAWQRMLAHVPQNIYLADASLAENIALGVPLEAINLEKVQRAAQQAQIAEYIESRPGGYSAMVGERGIRLSGGQRQRIGIARALYKEATVLIFDEATSALDNETEKSVMVAIDGLNRELTILLIAHRLTTVRRCDFVVEISQGRVVAQGTYDELIERSPSFRQMARAAG